MQLANQPIGDQLLVPTRPPAGPGLGRYGCCWQAAAGPCQPTASECHALHLIRILWRLCSSRAHHSMQHRHANRSSFSLCCLLVPHTQINMPCGPSDLFQACSCIPEAMPSTDSAPLPLCVSTPLALSGEKLRRYLCTYDTSPSAWRAAEAYQMGPLSSQACCNDTVSGHAQQGLPLSIPAALPSLTPRLPRAPPF